VAASEPVTKYLPLEQRPIDQSSDPSVLPSLALFCDAIMEFFHTFAFLSSTVSLAKSCTTWPNKSKVWTTEGGWTPPSEERTMAESSDARRVGDAT